MYVVISRKYTGEVVLPDDTNQLMANLEAIVNGTKAFNQLTTNNATIVINLNADMVDGAHKSTDSTFASTSDNLIPTEKAIKEYISNTFIFNLKPKTFEYRKRLKENDGKLKKDKYGKPLFRESGDGQQRWGLIAEEVDKVKKEFVFYDNDKKPSGVRYEDFISILIKVVQDQKVMIDDLESRLSILENK